MRTMKTAVVVAVILTIVLAGLAAGNTLAWPEQLFADNMTVETFEDGSGRATAPDGEQLSFCLKGWPCDDSLPPFIYLPIISQ